jgi:hypothetical protein
MDTPLAILVTAVVLVVVIGIAWAIVHCHSFGFFTACF